MASSATLNAEARTKLGSRACRALRANGMIPANLQPTDGKEHVDLAINAHEFLATRRKHVHLYDIELDGTSESAVVRELQWDVFGDNIIHVEFKRVTRGVETETEVELSFVGNAGGVVSHTLQHVTVLSIPSLIPDSIEVNIDGLEEGSHIFARDVKLPEGVKLAMEPDAEIAVISGIGGSAAEEAEDEDEDGDVVEGVQP